MGHTVAVLARYSMVRGVPASSLPQGIRQDTRKHTRHILRPAAEMVQRVLADADNPMAWRAFEAQYASSAAR